MIEIFDPPKPPGDNGYVPIGRKGVCRSRCNFEDLPWPWLCTRGEHGHGDKHVAHFSNGAMALAWDEEDALPEEPKRGEER